MTRRYTSSVTTIARRDADKTVSVIGVADGRIHSTLGYRTPTDGQAKAMDIAASRDGRRLFVIPGAEGTVLVYDTASWAMTKWDSMPILHEVGAGTAAANLALDEDRGTLWLSHSGRIRKLDLAGGGQQLEFQSFELDARTIAVNPATGELVAGGTTETEDARYPLNDYRAPFRHYEDDPPTLVRAYDPQSGKLARTYLGPGGTVLGLSINRSGSLIAAIKSRASPAARGVLLLWEARSGKLISAKEVGTDSIGDVAFSPDGTRLAYALGSVVHIVDLAP